MAAIENTSFRNSDPAISCFRKKAYSDDIARKVAGRLNHRNRGTGSPRVVVYGCTHCGDYHVGSERAW